MIDIQLTYKLFHQWHKENHISVIGSAFANNKLLQGNELIQFFKDCDDETTFIDRLHKLSGHFAVVITLEDKLLAAVDLIRTFPILFHQQNKEIIITDKIITDIEIDNNEVDIFKKVYCTLENNTLLKNWKQLQAGQYLVIDRKYDLVNIQTYYHHTKESNIVTEFNFSNKLNILEKKIVQQTIQYANNRTILVPLSGGYDSRYILALLKQSNYEHIECYTYGKKNSYEVLIAKNVAEKLNVKWHFIEYTDVLLDLFFTDKWQQYSNQNHHYTSLPHEQDFFALFYLQQQQLLPSNAIIVNGFCQDIHTGSFIEPIKNFDLQKFIYCKHEVRLDVSSYNSTWNGYQEWLIKNRLSKFIINSVRVYEYFGLDFYLPFWDIDWIDFWYSLDINERYHQKFYKKYLFDGIFKQYNIDYKKPNHDIKDRFYTLKKIAKSILPNKITEQIQVQHHQNKQNDVNNTLYLYEKIFKKLVQKPSVKDYKINNIHAAIFLENFQQNNS